MAHRSRVRRVVRDPALVRRGAVVDRPVVRPGARSSLDHGRDHERRRRRHRRGAAHVRAPAGGRCRVQAPRRCFHGAPGRGRAALLRVLQPLDDAPAVCPASPSSTARRATASGRTRFWSSTPTSEICSTRSTGSASATTRSSCSPATTEPDDMVLWRGSPGFWEGSYFAGGEGNLRTPCIARWPEAIPAGGVTDEIVHVTDWFATLLSLAGCSELVPTDRNIDGVDQTELLAGRSRARRGRDTSTGWTTGSTASSGGTSSSSSTDRCTCSTQHRCSRSETSSTSSATHTSVSRSLSHLAHMDAGALRSADRRVRSERDSRAADPTGCTTRLPTDERHIAESCTAASVKPPTRWRWPGTARGRRPARTRQVSGGSASTSLANLVIRLQVVRRLARPRCAPG